MDFIKKRLTAQSYAVTEQAGQQDLVQLRNSCVLMKYIPETSIDASVVIFGGHSTLLVPRQVRRLEFCVFFSLLFPGTLLIP